MTKPDRYEAVRTGLNTSNDPDVRCAVIDTTTGQVSTTPAGTPRFSPSWDVVEEWAEALNVVDWLDGGTFKIVHGGAS
jgi:hypothetical protein